MPRKGLRIFAVLFLLSSYSIASANTAPASSDPVIPNTNASIPEQTSADDIMGETAQMSTSFWHSFFIGIEGGYSNSNDIELKPETATACSTVFMNGCWNNPNQTYNNDISNAGVYGVRIGFKLGKFAAIDLAYDGRSGFSWENTTFAEPQGFPQSILRKINTIDNQTLLSNIYLTPNMAWGRIDPYLNAGLGTAWNRTSAVVNTNLTTGQIVEVSGARRSSFAWDIGAGSNIILTRHLFLNAGYRYMSLGEITTGSTIISPISAPITPLVAQSVYTNEVYAGINLQA